MIRCTLAEHRPDRTPVQPLDVTLAFSSCLPAYLCSNLPRDYRFWLVPPSRNVYKRRRCRSIPFVIFDTSIRSRFLCETIAQARLFVLSFRNFASKLASFAWMFSAKEYVWIICIENILPNFDGRNRRSAKEKGGQKIGRKECAEEERREETQDRNKQEIRRKNVKKCKV